MADLEKIVLTWPNLPGGTGNSTLFWRSGNAGVVRPAILTFIQNLAFCLPPSVSVTVPNNGEVIDEATGKMNNTWTNGTTTTTAGTATATAYTPNSGFLVQWRTAGFANGRAIRGRFFVVPASAGQYTSSGILLAASCSAIQTAAQSLVNNAASAFVIWHRPIYDHSVKPPVLTRPGASFPVTSANCPTKVATLKGRRDT